MACYLTKSANDAHRESYDDLKEGLEESFVIISSMKALRSGEQQKIR